MQMALDEGKRGLGLVHPNPPVGCIIVGKEGNIIARGAHLQFGGPHAEINALDKVTNHNELDGATLYVTLEPCAHEGKTPSCAKLLATLPIAKVVYAVEDPNPQVSGRGIDIIRAAGIEVELLSESIEKQECEALAEIFYWNMKNSAPFVAVKAATSRNGSLVPENNERWLTGVESQRHVHYLRNQYKAILVGVETFLQDDPQLNIRIEGQDVKSNHAVVLDPKGRGLEKVSSSKLRNCRELDKIIWVVGDDIEKKMDVQMLKVPIENGHFNLNILLKKLWNLEITSIFIEGGAKTFSYFLNAGLVNRVYHYSTESDVSDNKSLFWLSHVTQDILAQGKIAKLKFGKDNFESFLIRT